ncbi:MAG TPA: hypothetical protein VGZ22_07100, partial [Isosphaeraceae bacterium]|nr:hypothetical protein [Isosphaeraceae bacterium]
MPPSINIFRSPVSSDCTAMRASSYVSIPPPPIVNNIALPPGSRTGRVWVTSSLFPSSVVTGLG